MIKVVFNGGLGNQMFQYAFVYTQIKTYNLKPKIYAVMTETKFEDKRVFALDSLSCTVKMKETNISRTNFIFKFQMIIKKIVLKICRKFKTKDVKTIKILKKFNICYSPSIFKYYQELTLKNNGYVQGYFQTWKYFEKYKNELKKEFFVSKNISKRSEEMLEKIMTTESVCVHIRRGDYINSPFSKNVQICNFDYYKKGMDYISSKVSNPIFYVFSNSHKDHEWIKQNYKFDYPIVYVDLNNQDYEDLKLMSSCKHFIISNSTFSFWSQYLSNNEQKHVVAPSKWYLGNDDNADDIYMENWKIIDVGGKNENTSFSE